jgi:hypothetical protein
MSNFSRAHQCHIQRKLIQLFSNCVTHTDGRNSYDRRSTGMKTNLKDVTYMTKYRHNLRYTLLRDVRFLQQCWWIFNCGILRCGLLKDLSAFIVGVKRSMEVDCLNLKIKPQGSFEISVTMYQATRPNIPEDLKPTLILFERFFGIVIMKQNTGGGFQVMTLRRCLHKRAFLY